MNHAFRAARLRHRFSFRSLAQVTGLNHARLCHIEHGAPASAIEARIIRAALQGDLTVEELRGDGERSHAA
jgi:transcriptional regulator with XRE-family HTH domain